MPIVNNQRYYKTLGVQNIGNTIAMSADKASHKKETHASEI